MTARRGINSIRWDAVMELTLKRRLSVQAASEKGKGMGLNGRRTSRNTLAGV